MIIPFPPELYSLESLRLSISWNNVISSSLFSGSFVTQSRVGAVWKLNASSTIKDQDGRIAEAFFSKLQGALNRFTFYNPSHPIPAGPGLGLPKVNGTNQTGLSLVTNGWTGSQLQLKKGDFFSVNNEFKIVTDDCISTNGIATVYFQPPLRRSPTTGTPLVLNKPTCKFAMLTDFDGVQWFARGSHKITFEATEDPNP